MNQSIRRNYMERVAFWDLKILLYSGHVIRMGFQRPPTREDVDAIMGKRWRNLNEAEQDETWDYLLILSWIPEEPWTGTIITYYGEMYCCQKFLYRNIKDES